MVFRFCCRLVWMLSIGVVSLWAKGIELGVDRFFEEDYLARFEGKRIGLVTNHTAIDGQRRSTLERLKAGGVNLVALFSPEHGFLGSERAGEKVHDAILDGVRIYSLYGADRRPSKKMLEGIDLIIYDIQEIGSRSYTYATTLYYMMEEAARYGIELWVFDRPNPMGGTIVDGPMLEERYRSFVGYINVPYCHGMTIAELARFFNEEYRIGCKLTVIPMRGWKREMGFGSTGLAWVPTSPQIAEADTPLFYPITGILGELGIVNNGVGYTLPFKLIGAPWIDAKLLADRLNRHKLPGISCLPFYFKPYFGLYKGEECQGVYLLVEDRAQLAPVTAGYLIMGILKTLYPREVMKGLTALSKERRELFNKINGTSRVLDFLLHEKYASWKIAQIDKDKRGDFIEKRKKYLLYP